jgi:LmbE family N-acetylglucosaminyl deacetylase
MKPEWINALFGTGPSPALAVIVAHPDDEVIITGAQLPYWPHAQILHTTTGATAGSNDALNAGFSSPEEFALARRDESLAALSRAHIGSSQLHSLGFAEQETALHLIELTEAMVGKLLALQPTIVITQPYEGGHPDHDSTAFAVHAARDILLREQGMAPLVIEAASYFNRSGIMATSEFLPAARSSVHTQVLTEPEKAFKHGLFTCFRSQAAVLQYFPISWERFRLAPRYDFTRPPHPGKLYYELFECGMSGERWRRLAAAALKRLRHPAEPREPAPEPHAVHP